MRGSLIILASTFVVSGCFPVKPENNGTPTGQTPHQNQQVSQQQPPTLPGPTPVAWQTPTGSPVGPVTPARPGGPQFIDMTKQPLPGAIVGKPFSPGPFPYRMPNAMAKALATPTAPVTGPMTIPLQQPNGPALSAIASKALQDATASQTPEKPEPIQDPGLKRVSTLPEVPGTPAPAKPSQFPIPNNEVKDLASGTSQSAAPLYQLVNTKSFSLGFQVQDTGSGLGDVEVWSTRDMRNWEKVQAEFHKPSFYRITVEDEGVYGYTLVPKGKNGKTYSTPKAGDSPQVWVTVDLTKPDVELLGVELSLTTKKPSLVVRWNARDKNFTQFPVSLHFAESEDGPWTPLVANLKNTGRAEWAINSRLPRRIFVKVEAIDQTGNIGSAQTAKSVLVEQPWPPKTTAQQTKPTTVVPTTHVEPKPIALEQTPPRISISGVQPNE